MTCKDGFSVAKRSSNMTDHLLSLHYNDIAVTTVHILGYSDTLQYHNIHILWLLQLSLMIYTVRYLKTLHSTCALCNRFCTAQDRDMGKRANLSA